MTLTYNGKWHTLIETILSSAYKMLGVMRKLKYTFSLQALNQMYISYVRPLLEYSSFVWDGCSDQDKKHWNDFKMKLLEYRPYQVYVNHNLINGCGWDSLAKRRLFQKIVTCINADTTSSPITYLILSHHYMWLQKVQIILYVIVKILQML